VGAQVREYVDNLDIRDRTPRFSSRNTGVYFLRLPDMRTTFPQDQRPHQSGVRPQGSTPVDGWV